MIVAMVAVGVVQMTVHKVIDVVTVGYGLVSATGTVHMLRIMAATTVRRSAGIWIGLAHLDAVLNYRTIRSHVMQVPVVKVIDVILVLDAGVLAIRAMVVVVIFVGVTHRGISVFEGVS